MTPSLNAAMAQIAANSGDPADQSVYLTDARELSFFLWELFRVQDHFLGNPPSEQLTRGGVDAVLRDARAHATRLAESYQTSDRTPAHLRPDGSVAIPEAYYGLWEEHKRDWFKLRKFQDTVLGAEGQSERLPHLVHQVIAEMFAGANPCFMTYAGFTPHASSLVSLRGTPKQKQLLLPPLESVEWDACFCATEADAGTDLVAVSMAGERLDGEICSVTGHKRFITAGMHDLTRNTVYIVLGRMRDAKTNSLSLSCFLVPRLWPEDDGRLVPNHVVCAHVESKMGLNGCANTHLEFGKGGTTRSFLLGNQPNVALLQLSSLMRKARIGTGNTALAMASSAYLHSVRYARTRIQGAQLDQAPVPNARRVPIIEHADVQRMLLEMRAKVEGCRALVGRISFHAGKVQQDSLTMTGDNVRRGKDSLLLALYGPVAKAYISDEAWQIVTQAIQVHGAIGYLKDLPLEQYARDIKILSIWEGTNYIQAQDLVLSKLALGQPDSHVLRHFQDELRAFLARADTFPELAEDTAALRAAVDDLLTMLEGVRALTEESGVVPVSQHFTRFLESFGDVMAGWGLLEAATVSVAALRALAADHPDHCFYTGKIKTARYFIENILPRVHTKRLMLERFSRSYVKMNADEFGFAAQGAA
jgi:acyl-CoA dehydrogenase